MVKVPPPLLTGGLPPPAQPPNWLFYPPPPTAPSVFSSPSLGSSKTHAPTREWKIKTTYALVLLKVHTIAIQIYSPLLTLASDQPKPRRSHYRIIHALERQWQAKVVQTTGTKRTALDGKPIEQ